MRIVFDPDFSSGSWPGPLADRDASAGEEWVGAERFTQVLETSLGLPSPRLAPIERAARLVPQLLATDGFWSASSQIDPLGSARRLLEWRDVLALGGWRGEAREVRLNALGMLMREAAPGLPDRLLRITSALKRRDPGLESIALFGPIDDLEPLWRGVLGACARHGAHVECASPVAVLARGDLGSARSPQFDPRGDGTLTLLRPVGPMQAAEEVAAWLAVRAEDDFEGTVVVGGDPLLDAALHRHGLPTTGAPYARPDSSLLQLLPLVIEMAWDPPDPQRAFELLSLRPSPVPWEVAWPLREALRAWPALDSDSWRIALAEGLERIGDEVRRERVRERLTKLFHPEAERTRVLRRVSLAERVELLRQWLIGVSRVEAVPAGAGAAIAQCDLFLSLAGGAGLEEFTLPQLRRLVAESTTAVGGVTPLPAEAGITNVGLPGGVAGAAKIVVWWRFDLSAVPALKRQPLMRAEREELASLGVVLAEPARMVAGHARRWRRPLEQATEALLLVCPELGEDGERSHPHPLWDEIVARVGAGASRRAATARLVCPSFATRIPRERRQRLVLPEPRRAWVLAAGRIERRAVESPSSVETFLGCPFKWVLEYPGRLRVAESPRVPDRQDSRLLGSLLHRILNIVFAGDPLDPETAEARAGAVFDREAPRLAALLFLPGAETMRAQVRRAAMGSARSLASLTRSAQVGVTASELRREGTAFGTVFAGTPDLVLGPPSRIVDMKWGGAAFRQRMLQQGTATQLASYAYLVGEGGVFPPVAYFIMESQRLLSTDPGLFPGAETVNGPAPEDTWRQLERAQASNWKTVSAGRIDARGLPGDDGTRPPSESRVTDGELELAPPCRFCAFGALCGLSFVGEEA